MERERLTCKTHCIYWNSIDNDCELYGEHHPCPSKCISYWLQKIKVGRVFKQKNGEVFVISNEKGVFYSVIYNNGYTATYKTTDGNLQFVLDKLIASYPTWQEAVNSPEFKGEK